MTTRRQFLACLLPAFAGVPVALGAAEVTDPRRLGAVQKGQRTALQPSSSVSASEALTTAHYLLRQHNAGVIKLSAYEVEVRLIKPTGSMRPAVGDHDVVIVEKAPFETLGLGDAVIGGATTARELLSTGRSDWNVLHRIYGGKAPVFVVRGDNNEQSDPVRLTPTTYSGWRSIAVFHTRKA